MRPILPLLLFLAACGRAPQPTERANAEKLPCALGAGAAFAATCTVEKTGAQGLLIHHPDGGFRRLAIADDGRGVIAADGAEPARVKIVGDHQIEVAIGDDRYHLPATLKPSAK